MTLLASLGALAAPRAQPRGLADLGGDVGVGLLLRQLANVGILLQTTAHPDDENSAVLARLTRGQGVRTTLLTATRGTGGQNEIGPELFEALSVLRTEELASVHQFDGTEQYFARAVDFGYSFSVDETFREWGRQEILADYVRMIRTIRPDVIVTMRREGEQGGAHHQAQARITGDAFRLAADPTAFPDQVAAGLRPWQALKLYYQEGFGGRPDLQPVPGLVRVDADVYDPLLGQTYAEIGLEARSNHKCQGMAQLLALPGPLVSTYRLGDTVLAGGPGRAETALFDGIDTSIAGLSRFAGTVAPGELLDGLKGIAGATERAAAAFRAHGAAATLESLAAGLSAVRTLRARLGAMALDKTARDEIDYRLRTKEDQFARAAVLAQGVRIDVLADDGVVFPGQPVVVQVYVANRGTAPVSLTHVALRGFTGDASCGSAEIPAGAVAPRCDTEVRIPEDARLSGPYWHPLSTAARYQFDEDVPFGLPFRPTPFRARLDLAIGGAPVTVDAPVEYRYGGNIFSGEKRMELLVVPRFSVTLTPDIAIIPTTAKPSGVAAAPKLPSPPSRELRVVVTNSTKGPARAEAALELPPGWTATPPSATLEFAGEDAAATVRFAVHPPSIARPGEYAVRAVVRAEGRRFDQGYEVIEYPHIHRRHRIVPAAARIKLVDVNVVPGLKVGYVMGVGDQVPPAIEQLGVRVDLLGSDDLAWGDLARYDAIVTGVRAYERRADLRANNRRLIAYAEQGGTLVVQYNKAEFNDAQYGPYPARVGTSRVTDEHAPVRLLVPADPVFRFPNVVDDRTWAGWVQERGLYFLGEKDPRYVDLIELEDPFPANAGPKRGALVEAMVGKGRWIYVGLGLWRQLPAGTDGAYQLLANLLSRGRAGGRVR